MVQVIKSATFDTWLRKLKDRNAKARILVRIVRLGEGNPGDVKALGDGVSEMRIDYGPGYRIYFTKRGERIAVLLSGGDKATQPSDIAKAKAIADQWGRK